MELILRMELKFHLELILRMELKLHLEVNFLQKRELTDLQLVDSE